MVRSELKELHYLAEISNLPSIFEHGILCHQAAQKHAHVDISDGSVQGQRRTTIVPDVRRDTQLKLHGYAPLYICGRNPMLYVVLRDHPERRIVMLRVNKDILDLDGVVVTDGNAANGPTAFRSPDNGLAMIDREITFAGDPLAPTYPAFLERKRRQMAEALVPHCVPPEFLIGAYVADEPTQRACHDACGLRPIDIKPAAFTFPQ